MVSRRRIRKQRRQSASSGAASLNDPYRHMMIKSIRITNIIALWGRRMKEEEEEGGRRKEEGGGRKDDEEERRMEEGE